eukprot:15036070-Ditylum_brightwellii.AAC.1
MGDKDVALVIEAYEAAFCADVVAYYVFKMTEVMFMRMQYRGIYRDDGIVGGGSFQFTSGVWEPTAFQDKFNRLHKGKTRNAPEAKWLKQVKVISENEFPFLDMKMSCNK